MSSTRLPLIAIDGPAGAGKSTVARLLAHRLGLTVLDTGAMYRALALASIDRQIEAENETGLSDLTLSIEIRFSGDENERTLLDGLDVSEEIRTLEVGQRASSVSVHPSVRRELVRQQQAVIQNGGFVLEGRDTTTVVAPDADLKIFLTASIEERARRRWLDAQSKGDGSTLQEVVVDVVRRDHRDYSRADSPLMLAEDVLILETFGMAPRDVVERIVRVLEERGLVPHWINE